MANPNNAFDQADLNHDGVISEGEFRNFVRNSVVGNDINNLGINAGYGGSTYRASTYESQTSGGSNLGGNLNYNVSGFGGGAGYGASAYEASSYRSSVGNIGGDVSNLNVVGAAGVSAADAASASFSSASQSANFQYETDAQGNFKDPSPQVVRRPAQGGPLTYSQNIRVRFLQPPPVPAPGVRSFYSCLIFIHVQLILAIDH